MISPIYLVSPFYSLSPYLPLSSSCFTILLVFPSSFFNWHSLQLSGNWDFNATTSATSTKTGYIFMWLDHSALFVDSRVFCRWYCSIVTRRSLKRCWTLNDSVLFFSFSSGTREFQGVRTRRLQTYIFHIYFSKLESRKYWKYCRYLLQHSGISLPPSRSCSMV